MSKIDDFGTPKAYNHCAVGWAHALCAPYQWTKQVASHWGGTRNGTVVHWPKGIQGKGEIRTQFHHVIDVAKTILDVAGLPEPTIVSSIAQGRSKVSAWRRALTKPRLRKPISFSTSRCLETAVFTMKGGPRLRNTAKSHSVTAELTIPEGGAEGVIITQGGSVGGWSLYVKNGKLKYCYNFFGINHCLTEAEIPIPAGKHQVRMEFNYDAGGLAKGGGVMLYYDGKPVGKGRVDHPRPTRVASSEIARAQLTAACRGSPTGSSNPAVARNASPIVLIFSSPCRRAQLSKVTNRFPSSFTNSSGAC